MAKLLLACLLGSALTLGCTSSTPLPTLTINSITSEASVGDQTPASGDYFAQLNVTLANPSTAEYSAWFYYYALGTEPNGLAITPSFDANEAVAMPCSFEVNLAPEASGGPVPSYTCNVVFDVPCAQIPVVLSYYPAPVTVNVPTFEPPACPTSTSSSSSTSSTSSSSGGTGGSAG